MSIANYLTLHTNPWYRPMTRSSYTQIPYTWLTMTMKEDGINKHYKNSQNDKALLQQRTYIAIEEHRETLSWLLCSFYIHINTKKQCLRYNDQEMRSVDMESSTNHYTITQYITHPCLYDSTIVSLYWWKTNHKTPFHFQSMSTHILIIYWENECLYLTCC